MRSDPALALSLSLVVALAYLAVLRLIDPYEKEPLWALCMMLFFGAASAGCAAALVPADTREDTALGIALTAEASKALAIALGMAAFAVVKRVKGWSEVNGLIDGVVYGAAAGLGFATGSAFVSEIAFSTSAGQLPGQPGFLDALLTTALSGLSEGLFGGMIGAGLVAASEARSPAKAFLLGAAGLLTAVVTHFAYAALADPGSPYDTAGPGGRWLPLGLSLALLLVLMVRAASEERRLAGEMRDASWPGGAAGRRVRYFRAFKEGELEDWLKLRALHSRQVQLAVAERRLRETPEWAAARRRAMEAEVRNLRASLAAIEHSESGALVDRRLTTRRGRATAWTVAAATVAAGLAAIAFGALSERDARASAAEDRARERTPSVRQSAPPSRGLRDRVVHRAGPYLLVEGREDGAAPAGATDALVLTYATPGREKARHQVARFGSADAAVRSRERIVRRLDEGRWEILWRSDLGTVITLERKGGSAVVWSSGRLQSAVTAQGDDASDFYLNVPY
jgi:protease PrsW